MTRSFLASTLAAALLTIVGCTTEHGGPTGADGDAAINERGAGPTGTTTGDAPSLERSRDDRINAPVAP